MDVLSLRPRDKTSDGIAAAITRMDDVLVTLRGRHAALQGARRGVLLTGDDAALARNETEARGVALDIDRLTVAAEDLRADLSITRGRESLTRLEGLRTAAHEAVAAFRSFWTTEYEGHARAIAAGLAKERSARTALAMVAEAVAAAHRDPNVSAAGGVGAFEVEALPSAYHGAATARSPSSLVCLPAARPALPIAWPAPSGPRGEAAAYAS